MQNIYERATLQQAIKLISDTPEKAGVDDDLCFCTVIVNA